MYEQCRIVISITCKMLRVTFHFHAELENIITNIQKQWKKGKSITATQLKSSNCIVVSNIDDQYYDEQFLLNYFENQKRSGGGAVESVKLCGNGKAMIVFQNQDGKLIPKCI